MKAVILTEANAQVASGHLMECIVFAHELLQAGLEVMFLINENAQQELKKRIDIPYQEYPVELAEQSENLAAMIAEFGAACVVMNLRQVQECFLARLRSALLDICVTTCPLLICIDELGRRPLPSADAVINPMVDPHYWEYPGTACPIYCGQQYLILSDKLAYYRQKSLSIKSTINRITVSMGGVDKPGTTLKLASWLPELLPGGRINLVCGGGFLYSEELDRLVIEYENVYIYHNIDFLYNLFWESDIVFCAGGNTLHELAALGIPTVVIPSVQHELCNGLRFSEKGFGKVVKEWENLSKENVALTLGQLSSQQVRECMSLAGRSIVDEFGKVRTCKVVLDLLTKKENLR